MIPSSSVSSVKRHLPCGWWAEGGSTRVPGWSRAAAILAVAAALSLGACTPRTVDPLTTATPLEIAAGPEALGTVLGKRAEGRGGMVAAGHPAAAEAGQEVLRLGGSAVDAAIATSFAIGVVEPMMSGLGGGGGMVIWSADSGGADFVEFYSTAAAAVDSNYRDNGSLQGARGVAIPGEVAGLLSAHERHGKLPLAQVMAPAIRLADEGFSVHGMLARVALGDSAKLSRSAARAQELFLPGGRPIAAGTILRQPELAATLRRIAAEGRDGFYRGAVAEEIIRTLNAGGNPMTMEDMASFQPRWRRPVCGSFMGRTVITAAPPLSGSEVVESLNLLSLHDWEGMGFPQRDPQAFDAMVTSIRAARSDRNAFTGDPAFNYWPASAFASTQYAARRLTAATARPEEQAPGDPAGISAAPEGRCAALDPWQDVLVAGGSTAPAELPDAFDDAEGGETTHISVVDAKGNAVALTVTQGLYFGSGSWAAGTFLNSAMGNFSAASGSRNRAGPGRIPSTTIAPTILLDSRGSVEVVVGSPASGRIPPAVVQTLLYTLQFGMDPYSAVSMPRAYPSTGTRVVQIEQGFNGNVLAGARSMGWVLQQHAPIDHFFGGVAVLVRRDGRWIGAADPRRSGEVRAQ